MAELTYETSSLSVREDLLAEHQNVWCRLARPGTWWTGAERVAIAAEARNAPECDLCRRRKETVSPYGVEGEHDSLGNLPATAIEAIHRITTDPGRITQKWVEGLFADGLSDGHYVEIIGILYGVLGIDNFSITIGADQQPLPEPEPGEPTRERPEQAKLDGAWLPMVAVGEDTGVAEDIYGGAKRLPNVIRALSLVPEEVRQMRGLSSVQYIHHTAVIDPSKGNDTRSINRSQIELIASRVSKFNECFY